MNKLILDAFWFLKKGQLGMVLLGASLLIVSQCSSGSSGSSDSGSSGALLSSVSNLVIEEGIFQSQAETQKAGLRTLLDISVIVKNKGGVAAVNSKLRFLRSVDDVIDVNDTKLGDDILFNKVEPDFFATYTPTETVFSESLSTGETYYGACLLIINEDINKCTDVYKIDVFDGADISLLDFEARSTDFLAEATSFGIGSSARFIVQLGNYGNGGLSAAVDNTIVTFYRSRPGAANNWQDTELGTVNGNTIIGVGTEAEVMLDSLIPDKRGTYYYGACVVVSSEVENDRDLENNCTAGMKITVVDGADIEPVNFIIGPSPLLKNDGFTSMSVLVRNNGNTPLDLAAGAGDSNIEIKFYRSIDETITKDDLQVGEEATLINEMLEAKTVGSSEIRPAIRPVLATDGGEYYYGVCLKAIPARADKNRENNCSVGVKAIVKDQIELAPSDLRPNPTEDADLFSGDRVISIVSSSKIPNLSVKVVNNGSLALAAVSLNSNLVVNFYRSGNTIITSEDKLVNKVTSSYAILPKGKTDRIFPSVRVVVPAFVSGQANVYYYGVCVVPLPEVEEKDYDYSNNCTTKDSVIKVRVTAT